MGTPAERRARHFRPDIQGLRAIAVGLVVVYHAALLPFSGGYVGVDVFFVISGFLITSHLMRELEEHGRVRLLGFWGRRVSRLLPAAWLVLLVTLFAAWLIVPPLERPGLAYDAGATALYGINVWLAARMTSYLDSGDPSVFQHYWSLALEEQFYFIWPLVLWGVWRLTKRRAAVVGALVVMSFALGVWLTGERQPWAFFLLPSRAWELGVGALLALVAPRGSVGKAARRTDVTADALSLAGLVLVLMSGYFFTEVTPFPGVWAAIPVAGAALMVAFGERAALVSKLMSAGPMQFLGRISYSLYLWHWPLVVLPEWAGWDPTWVERLVAMAIAVVLADATQRWVEMPFQKGLRRSMVRTWGVMLAGTSATVASAAVASHVPTDLDAGQSVSAWSGGSPVPPDPGFVPSNVLPALKESDANPRTYADGCHVDMPESAPKAECRYGHVGSHKKVFLLGDSHAAQWFPGMEEASKRSGRELINLTKSSCTPADMPVFLDAYGREYRECAAWREQAVGMIEAADSPLVVIASSSKAQPMGGGGDDEFARALRRTIAHLGEDARVVLVADGAWFAEEPNVCLSANIEDSSMCVAPVEDVVELGRTQAVKSVAAAEGADFVDAAEWQCIDGDCSALAGNVLIYRDSHHVGVEFSELLHPEWEEVFRRAS